MNWLALYCTVTTADCILRSSYYHCEISKAQNVATPSILF